MSLLDRLKEFVGWGSSVPAETEGSDVAVHVEHPAKEELDEEIDELELEDIKGIGPAYAERLRKADITTVAELADASAASLASETDLSETRIATWIERARGHVDASES